MDMLRKEVIHIPGGMEWNAGRLHGTPNAMPLKLMTSSFMGLSTFRPQSLQVTETMGGKTMDKEKELYLYFIGKKRDRCLQYYLQLPMRSTSSYVRH